MSNQPNVIIILSDDQGYGDFGCHGNPWLKTPNLDNLATKGVELTDFHTSPMCAPTRAGLMSGKYPDKVGVWSTLNGCFIMREETIAMPQMFKDAGYKTAMFGKWHLGDSYPYRALDKGFDHVLSFGGGVISEVPDYWNNDYFDDKYLVNGQWQDFDGYCTDVWFDNAIDYIEKVADEDQGPFFCYIANNAPHRPFTVDSNYSDKYKSMGLSEQIARFYGMIENIDENYGRLEEALDRLNLMDNTIIVYFGDNGTCGGAYMDDQGFIAEGYNAGLRGKKCDPYEGGHKNSCFIHWPQGQLKGGYEVHGLSTNFDLYPTLMAMTGIEGADRIDFDGVDVTPFLKKPESTIEDRTLVIHNMQFEHPVKYKDYCVLTNEWRLTQNNIYNHKAQELYEVKKDPGQSNNLISQYPSIAEKMTDVYEAWWSDVSVEYQTFSRIAIGSHKEPVTTLTSHAWHGSTEMSYNQLHVRQGINDEGYWTLQVLTKGTYTIELRRWPREAEVALSASVPGIKGTNNFHDRPEGKVYEVIEAGIDIQGKVLKQKVHIQDASTIFRIDLEQGPAELKTWFNCKDGQRISAYYAYVELI